MITAPMIVATGMPNRKPEPRNLKGALSTVRMLPSVISIAMPRPAVIRISVAMIGWMPRTATRNPFHTPISSESPSAASTATATTPGSSGFGEPRMIEQATAPAIAQIEPTERSMPRVAITRVMPTAMISVGAPLRTMSITLPNRWPCALTVMARKPGTAITLIASRATSMATGQNSRCEKARPT